MQPGTDARRRASDRLIHPHTIGWLHERRCGHARVLIERDHISLAQTCGSYRLNSGALLVSVEPEAATQCVPGRHAQFTNVAAGCAVATTTPGAGCMTMQSTGQGGMHNSQPVHSAAMTVCMKRDPPMMAST